MTEEKQETTTLLLKRVAPGLSWLPRILREHFSPAAAWSVLCVLVSCGVTIGEFIHRLDQDSTNLRELKDRVQELNTKVEVMNTEVENMKGDIADQQQWREHIEDAAERPVRRK